ncbi:hypothetical protein K8Z61_11280 [Nocardioides sp. TRM66260-LWL]|uniref:hypothetical protein n=1 Tax=Nocardioides sp. TRM66260-LWL TaxID=2874478 RepID=UPI001CC6E128|nr:hypothetical protein [Nocardioides sp. TRM66260-LWL]MBZ5735081.1 hypothetical protein [Nocardioides sp. TRM66260-LWL]
MTPIEAVVGALTGLGLVVVVLTRVRLRAATPTVGAGLLALHTGAGLAASVLWSAFLLAGPDTLLGGPGAGVLALGGWWVASLAGLAVLMRWLPSKGRHAHSGAADAWTRGPWLSVLAHVGLLLATVLFTWVYLRGTV